MRRPLWLHPQWLALLLALSCTLGAALLLPEWLRNIEERAGDWLWRQGASNSEERRLIIVDIDDDSVARLGPWPWRRELVADLARKTSALGASGIAFDIVFPEPLPGDKVLALALAETPSVIAQLFSLNGTPVAAGRLQGALNTPSCGAPIPTATGHIGNAPLLRAAAGHIVPRVASDGSIRHLPPLICHEGKAYPGLGLALLLRAANSSNDLTLTPGNGWLAPAWELRHPEIPGITIPVEASGDTRLSYQKTRQAFTSVSASDVLEGRAPANLFRGAWVLVGATAFGISDAVPTPHGGAVGGIEVHAQFLSALLDDRLPYTPQGTLWLQWAGVLLSGALLLLLSRPGRALHPSAAASRFGSIRQLPAWGLPLGSLLLGGLLFAAHALALLRYQLWIGWALPALFAVSLGLLLAIIEHARTRFERERLYRNLAAYLPAAVASRIALHEVRGIIDAERREITVFFADIRNFSAYCEGRPPEEAAALLHAFFSTAARVVEAHDGVLEEFVGDAIMAVWNAPQAVDNHPQRAYAAAIELLEEGKALFPETAPPGLEPLALGIGIECGDALVGSFGPVRRRTHSALGETVTIAARLTALTGDLAHPLLIGEKAAQRLPQAGELLPLGSFLLDGLRRPHRIYTLPPESASATPAT